MASRFDQDRFREAVLYVAWQTRRDRRFGRVKMAKTLFYADFEAFADEGAPVTGAKYRHWPFGPFPPALYDLEGELERTGEAVLQRAEFEGDEIKLIALREPATPNLEAWQKQLLDLKMSEISAQSSRQVSDRSHHHPAWTLTREEEAIPYEAALIPDRPSGDALEIARHRFATKGPPF